MHAAALCCAVLHCTFGAASPAQPQPMHVGRTWPPQGPHASSAATSSLLSRPLPPRHSFAPLAESGRHLRSVQSGRAARQADRAQGLPQPLRGQAEQEGWGGMGWEGWEVRAHVRCEKCSAVWLAGAPSTLAKVVLFHPYC